MNVVACHNLSCFSVCHQIVTTQTTNCMEQIPQLVKKFATFNGACVHKSPLLVTVLSQMSPFIHSFISHAIDLIQMWN